MNDRISKQKDLLRLIGNSVAIGAVLPLHLPRVGFAVYLIYVFHIFNLWNAEPPKGSRKDVLSQGVIFLSGVAGLILLFFSLRAPWWSILFCVLLLGQIAILSKVEQLRKQMGDDALRIFRICRWVLTGMNLLVLITHLYMIAVGHTGRIQGSVALYDAAFWIAKLMDIPRVITGIFMVVETYCCCRNFRSKE